MEQTSKGAPTSQAASPNGSITQQKSKPTKALPTPRINIKKQLEMLRAYAIASGTDKKTVTNKAIAELVSMHENTTTMANPFFVENGFLQRGEGGFLPAEDVFAFARAYEWNADTASYKLAPIIAASWFGQALIPKLEFKPLEKKSAINELADIAKAGPDYEPQLQFLLDYMAAAGLIQQEGSLIRANKAMAAQSQAVAEQSSSTGAEASVSTRFAAKVSTLFAQPTEGAVNFQVNVRVDMNEFAGWKADRIAAFFSGIAQVLAAKGAIEKEASGDK